MSNNDYGKLKLISNIKTIWKDEEKEFSPFVADNIDLLSDAIKIPIDKESVRKEVPCGKYWLDIIAKEENTDNIIVIENQLDTTDHRHLGEILTYAAGQNAKYVIWIAAKATEEHQKTIEWLNEHTDNDVSFFLVQMEVWTIDNSKPAPKFSIVVKPNDWFKTFKQETKQLNETDKKILNFWEEFKEYGLSKGCSFLTHTPSTNRWYRISMGKSGYYVCLNISFEKIYCEFIMNTENIQNNKTTFHELEKNKDLIEKEIGCKLKWRLEESQRRSVIEIEKKLYPYEERKQDAFDFLLEYGDKFVKVFSKYKDCFK